MRAAERNGFGWVPRQLPDGSVGAVKAVFFKVDLWRATDDGKPVPATDVFDTEADALAEGQRRWRTEW